MLALRYVSIDFREGGVGGVTPNIMRPNMSCADAVQALGFRTQGLELTLAACRKPNCATLFHCFRKSVDAKRILTLAALFWNRNSRRGILGSAATSQTRLGLTPSHPNPNPTSYTMNPRPSTLELEPATKIHKNPGTQTRLESRPATMKHKPQLYNPNSNNLHPEP
jgi:hypothetical protein